MIMFDEDTHLLDRAVQLVDVGFEAACFFLNQQGNAPVAGEDLARLRHLAWHLYNRYSSVMQLYNHYARVPLDERERNILPLKPLMH